MSNAFLALIRIFIIFNPLIATDLQRSDATIEVLSFQPRKVIKRDLSNYKEQHVVYEDAELIRLKVHAFNTSYNMDLKPIANNHSIFGSNFIYNVIDTNTVDGSVLVEDITPSVEELYGMQNQIYTDSNTGSVVTLKYSDGNGNVDKVENLTGNNIVLNGLVYGGRIKREAGAPHHVLEFQTPFKVNLEAIRNDYVYLKTKLTARSGNGQFGTYGKFTIYPELAIVADYGEVGRGVTELDLLEYVATLIAGVNARYSMTDDPLIICEIVSFHVIKSGSVPAFVATLNSTMTNGVPHYGDGISFLNSFASWAKTNQGTIIGFGANEHDIMVLLTSRQTGVGGRGFQPGACNTDASDFNFATVYAGDGYGSFTYLLSHEIGHSLGASHDDEHGDASCGQSHIMGDMNGAIPNHPILSPCSLKQIKAYAQSSAAACLSIKSSPSSYIKSKGHLRITAQKACEIYDRQYPYPWYQGPDDSCRRFLCWNREHYHFQVRLGHAAPINGMACGSQGTGQCRNGYCLGDKPTTLSGICRQATGDPTASFVHPESHSPCAANITCNASLISGQNTLMTIWTHPPTGTICGNIGEVCVSRACTLNMVQPNGNCLLHTGTDGAVEEEPRWDGQQECNTGTKCIFGSEYEWLKKPNNGESCNDGDGECFEGKCIPKDGSLRFTVLDACKLITGDSKPTIIFNQFEEGARDVLCSKLGCRDAQSRVREATSLTPDGTVCGPLKVCKNGKCVYHLW